MKKKDKFNHTHTHTHTHTQHNIKQLLKNTHLPSSAALTRGEWRHVVSPFGRVMRCCSRSRDDMSLRMIERGENIKNSPFMDTHRNICCTSVK